VIDKLLDRDESDINTLIIVPTRELAIQIEQQIQGFSYFTSVSSVAVYGGGDGNEWVSQKEALMKGTDVVIATPGKLLSLLKTGDINLKNLRHLILDEADRMLDMGFIDDIQTIISYLPKKRQTLMFSATMPKTIRHLARNILHNPVEISMSVSKPVETIDQKAFLVFEKQKDIVLLRLLTDRKDNDSILIFTSTKSKVSEIYTLLNRHGFHAHGISSNLEQDKREDVLSKFRSKRIKILVATDVLSRGIDVKEIRLVINYDVPNDAEDYVHRVGRTARINTPGEAITLVTPREIGKFNKIEKLIEADIPKPEPYNDIGQVPRWEDSIRKPAAERKIPAKKKFSGHRRYGYKT